MPESAPGDPEVQAGALRIALMKAFMNLWKKGQTECPPLSTAIAELIFKYYNMPYTIMTGYLVMRHPETGALLSEKATPSMWLSTTLNGKALITDLTYTPSRRAMILGTPVGMDERDIVAQYATMLDAGVRVNEATLPLHALETVALDLDGYLKGAPDHVKAMLGPLLAVALDGSTKVVV